MCATMGVGFMGLRRRLIIIWLRLCSKLVYDDCVCASGAAANATLWQVQLTGIGKGAFAFQIKATASEAFREYPDPRVCIFNDLEAFS